MPHIYNEYWIVCAFHFIENLHQNEAKKENNIRSLCQIHAQHTHTHYTRLQLISQFLIVIPVVMFDNIEPYTSFIKCGIVWYLFVYLCVQYLSIITFEVILIYFHIEFLFEYKSFSCFYMGYMFAQNRK